jgi:quercetin dioxygenase-like cupin family protein
MFRVAFALRSEVSEAHPFRLRRTKKRDRKKGKLMSFIQTVETSKTEAIPAPFPNTKGTATIKVLNSDESFGPAVAILRMEPGSEIARHLHGQTTEMSYVLDGDFINEGISYPKGTEFNIKPNTAHGPHTTKNGCSLLVTFSYPSILDDFQLT